MFGGNFAPRDWALCNGQLLAVNQNPALFSILGTTYGGDGRTSFALPDLRGRFPMHAGNGPGLTARHLGERGGSETTTLTVQNMPSHDHNVSLHGELATADKKSPQGHMLALSPTEPMYAAPIAAEDRDMATESIREQSVGGNAPFNAQGPYQALNFIIALQGVFPSRS